MTSKYSFIDIFSKEIISKNESIIISEIIIPIIQRDYAQGRKDSDINRIRSRFLEELHNAFTDKPLTLDFIYGNIDENGIMTPLDGQQRLTTLFLLHWYIAKKENIDQNEYDFLKKFSYQTRYSARNFCSKLIDFKPEFKEKISNEIINQSWFPLDWKKDPTIDSMLVMLDDISEKFNDLDNAWNQLKNGIINFYFLPIKDMELTDELYIKMNSRGKPLTTFENLKAELEHELTSIDKNISNNIISKIDSSWTDMLWLYRDDSNTIDDGFIHYFKFICDVICYKKGETAINKSNDELDLIKEYFSKKSTNVENNIKILENYFDCFVGVSQNIGIECFFNKYMSNQYEKGKICIDKRYQIDIFKDCILNYGDFIENRNSRKFSYGRFILLYAFITYLLNQDNITEEQFRRRIRIVNNLINNSLDEMSSSEGRTGGNRIPIMLKQVDSIIIDGVVSITGELGFNSRQLQEEKEKLIWTTNNKELSETLFKLEDNEYLYGQIAILGLENFHLFEKFNQLFNCELDKIDCALMSIGNYGQSEKMGNKIRYQFGSKSINHKTSWKKLFHSGSNKDFETTKKIFIKLLSSSNYITNESLDTIINNYLKKCEEENLYEWRYYYIKYEKVFRPGKYGTYYWNSYNDNPYDFSVMFSPSKPSQNSYQPFLKEIDFKNGISTEHMGQRIIDRDIIIKTDNNSYRIYINNETEDLKEIIHINQNSNGIDIENRIIKMKNYYKN